MNKADFNGVWVFAEQREGQLQKVSLELLGEGRKIADKLGSKLTALLIGNKVQNLVEDLSRHGADEVLVVDAPELEHYTTDGYTKAICELANAKKPNIIFIGATFIGRDLGPRVAARLETGLTADCTSLDVDVESGDLFQHFLKLHHFLLVEVFEKLPLGENDATVENVEIKFNSNDIRTKIVEIIKEHKDIVDISEANVLVAGGRGIGSEENFKMLKELAEVMNGSIAASRAAVEKGWVDKDYQVGQTGKTVRPNIYVACGISGAIQHAAGMQDSDMIIAINKDANAPIMKIADYAIVGDVNKVVPEFIAQLKAMKEEA